MNTRLLRNGLTLVEMLVATAITLLLIAGLAQAFQVVGGTVASQRAGLVMAGQLRSVSLRLQRDLTGLTASVGPWADHLSGNGYFEYREGTSHDGTTRTTIGTIPDLTAFGDGDDVLMFTSRSSESPFTGIYYFTSSLGVTTTEPLTSQLAEIAWWGTLTDHNDNGALDVEQGDDFTIYRRTLLIRPDLNTNTLTPPSTNVPPYFYRLGGTATFDTTSGADMMTLADLVRDFYNNNDLSVRFVRDPPGTGGTVAVYVVANSLQDLTDRRHRFAHAQIVDAGFNYRVPTFPYNIDRSNSVTGLLAFRYPDAVDPRGVVKSGARQGEDVVLSRATAFDVRAFDPLAVLSFHPSSDGGWGSAAFDDDGDGTDDDPMDLTVEQDEAGWVGSDDEVIGPGEAGYGVLPSGGSTLAVSTALGSILPAGRGAYVDLNYQRKIHGTSATYDLLSSTPALRSHFSIRDRPVTGTTTRLAMPTYDTWPRQYEYDGVNQDGDALTDEGTDGLDTDAANGVDDRAELETSPPYLSPLRGIQVRIRMIDHDSRQVRQVTVESNFVPD